VIRQYQEVHTAFFKERSLIPEDHFHELAFADLERNPLDEMKRLYARLNLPNFAHVEPKLRTYLASQSDYRKNTFPDLPPKLRRRCFEEWGYGM